MSRRPRRGSAGSTAWRPAIDQARATGRDDGFDGSAAGSGTLPEPAALSGGLQPQPARVDAVTDPNIVLRRVLTLAAVSAIVPGLGHLLVGRDRSGRPLFSAYLRFAGLAGLTRL